MIFQKIKLVLESEGMKGVVERIKLKLSINFIILKAKMKKLINKNKTSDINNCIDSVNIKSYAQNYKSKVSVIVLNRNNKNVIFKCIDNLKKYNNLGYEIIVVDNQSEDGSYDELKSKYNEKIVLLKNDRNGCSSGRNLGVRNTNRDIIVFLDSDQIVCSPDWLDAGLYILNMYNIGCVGWCGGWFLKNSIIGITTDNLKDLSINKGQLYRNDMAFLGSGGMLIKRDIFDKIGGFDENYDPTCFEDTDLSLKIRKEGFKLAYTPYINIEHLLHQTTNSGSIKHRNLIKMNGRYFLNKWIEIDKCLLKQYYK